MISRRSLFIGGATFGASLLIAAPSIVRPRSLMPIRPMIWEPETLPPPNVAHFFEHYGDGSFFEETVNFDTRTSTIKWQYAIPLWGGQELDVPLQAAEDRRLRIENFARRTRNG